MAIIKRILAPTDLSDLSVRGLKYACNLAKEIGAEVIIVHVIRVEEVMAEFRRVQENPTAWDHLKVLEERLVERHEQMLDDLVNRQVPEARSDINIRKVVEVSEPYAALIERAKNDSVDLIVMSTHGRSGIARVMLGSVTEKVLRSSPCPVLAVPLPHGN